MRYTLASLALLAVGGCGGGGPSYSTPQEVIAALAADGVRCTGVEREDPQLFVREQAECTIGDEGLDVYTFGSDDAQRSWLDTATKFGGVYVVGDGWIVMPERQETARAIQGAIGGTLR